MFQVGYYSLCLEVENKMTSKQALEEIIDEIKYTHNDGKTLTPFDKKRIDIIAKDLELLDILKGIVKIVDCSKHPTTSLNDQLVILSGGAIKSVEDYEKIKKWLEEE